MSAELAERITRVYQAALDTTHTALYHHTAPSGIDNPVVVTRPAANADFGAFILLSVGPGEGQRSAERASAVAREDI